MTGPTRAEMRDIEALLKRQNELLEDIAEGVAEIVNKTGLAVVDRSREWVRPSKRKEGK